MCTVLLVHHAECGYAAGLQPFATHTAHSIVHRDSLILSTEKFEAECNETYMTC